MQDAPHRVRYQFGDFELRPDQSELRKGGAPVRIQPQPLKVLTILVEHAGELVPRRKLVARVWGEDTHVDFDRGLNYCIKQVRAALGDDAAEPTFIRTLPRVGYRFEAAVRRTPGRPAAAPVGQKSAMRRAATATGTAFALVLISLGTAWWFAPATSRPAVTDPAALREFLRGRHVAESGAADAVPRSLEHFERAVAIAPEFARGHLGLAEGWARMPGDPTVNAARSRAAVLRALELDPDLAQAHAHLGSLKLYGDWDWTGAESAFRRAVELAPRSAPLHHAYANLLALRGRHDLAIAQIERAMELDPLSTSIKADAGWYYYLARRYDDAVRLCRVTLEIDVSNRNALWCLVQSHSQTGSAVSAIAAARRLADELDPGEAPAIADLQTFWRWYLGWLERNPTTPSTVGLAHLALGNRAEALDLFEQAYAGHSSCVLSIAADPQLDPLRGNPRFEELLAKLGLSG